MLVKTILILCVSSLLVQTKQKTAEPEETRQKNTQIEFVNDPSGVTVLVGGQVFTRYDFMTHGKPILFPVFGPEQIPMTRSGPMKKVAGEADDHPHHKSIWVGHEINGVDFWKEKGGTQKQYSLRMDEKNQTFSARNFWLDEKYNPILLDETKYKFGADNTKRWIDVSMTFSAANGDITFADTKEGLFAIRTHPDLRLKPDEKLGVKEVFGNAINSNGTGGQKIWGESAKWVYYWGPIDEKDVGIAFFDHPTNLRHPTTWHARDYGLIAANPFGLHYFKKGEKGAGEHTLKKGKKLTFRYRLVFQLGQQTAEELNKQFDAFAKTK